MNTSTQAASVLTPNSTGSPSLNKFAALAARFTELWWVKIPGKLRQHSTLLWAAWSDGTYLTAWPRVATILPMVVFAIGFLEGATHWTMVQWNPVGAQWSMTYVGHGSYAWVFAQILPLLVFAVIAGGLSANLGLMLATGYALGDFLLVDEPWTRHDVISRFFHFHVPQLICYLLFLLLAVWPVVCAKSLVASVHRRLREQADGVYTAVTAIVLALFVYEWTYMAPMVFRVAWVLQAGIASPFSVVLFQAFTMPWLVTSAVVGVLLRHWLSDRAEARDGDGLEARGRTLMAQAAEAPAVGRPWLQALLGAAYITLLMSGFLDAIAVGALIFAAIFFVLLARSYLLPRTSLWNKWRMLVCRVPALFRLAAVSVAAYFITLSLLAIPGMGAAQNPRAGQFGVEILALLISFLLMVLLLPNGVLAMEESGALRQGLRVPVPGTATQIGLIVALALLATKRAFAHCSVCADPGCCFGGNNNVAGAVNGGFMPSYTGGIPRSGPMRPDPRWKKRGRPSHAPKGPQKSPQTPDPCADQKQGVTAAQDNVDRFKNQLDQYEKEMVKDESKMSAAGADAQRWLASLKSEANTTLLANPASTFLNGLPSDLTQLTPSQLQQVLDLNLPDSQMFVDAVTSLQNASNDRAQAEANAKTAQDNLDDARTQLANAQKALADCQASQSGNASAGGSTGDGAGATP